MILLHVSLIYSSSLYNATVSISWRSIDVQLSAAAREETDVQRHVVRILSYPSLIIDTSRAHFLFNVFVRLPHL